MTDAPLEERLAAVERALTDGEETPPDLAVSDPDLVDRFDALEADVDDLEAAVQAVRGYVGSVKHVNDEVEQRADAAMAKAQAIEQRIETADAADDGTDGSLGHGADCCPRCGRTDTDRQSSDPTSPEGERFAPGDGRFGHQRLEADERSDGLLARLREVL